jgi:hypothetical protein
MQFHHVEEKDFSPSYIIHSRSWESAQKELDKCILLCANCHAEEHWGIFEPEPLRVSSYERIKENRSCRHCSSDFRPRKNKQVFCSERCSSLSRRVVNRPSLEVLKEEIEKETWMELGKKYGVAHSTVQRWAKRYGLMP